eukprot:10426681-Karenia_brevis.AAC.1
MCARLVAIVLERSTACDYRAANDSCLHWLRNEPDWTVFSKDRLRDLGGVGANNELQLSCVHKEIAEMERWDMFQEDMRQQEKLVQHIKKSAQKCCTD